MVGFKGDLNEGRGCERMERLGSGQGIIGIFMAR